MGAACGLFTSLKIGTLLALATAPAAAQQSRMPAAWEGVSPPATIAGLPDVRPLIPLEFSRAWLGRVEEVRHRRAELLASGELAGMQPEELAARGAALSGTLRIPVIPVRYSDVPEPFPVEALEERIFGASRGDTLSFAAYWDEVSGGLLKIEGEVAPWVTLSRPAAYYLPESEYGWGRFGRIRDLREEAIRAADRLLDLRTFDNDGPDGVPGSADDDGFVDFVAILYALPCQRDARAGAIWPHRAAMAPIKSRHTTPAGQPLRVTDYVIIPAVDQATCGPLPIGLLAHETGHALGLPDLYDYTGASQGIGAWGLMGTGSHSSLYSPAHLSAWEKEQLGWVGVEWLQEDGIDVAFRPVQTSRTVYRYDPPESAGEYILIENRQRLGSDRRLPGHGLLIWHIDPERAELGAWNNDERRPAVRLIEADGRSHPPFARRADGGDPYPGDSRQREFLSHLAPELHLSEITERGGVVSAHVRTGYAPPSLTVRPWSLRLAGVVEGTVVRQSVDVRRRGGADFEWEPEAAPAWLRADAEGDVLHLAADPAGLGPGEYRDSVVLRSAAGERVGVVPVSLLVTERGLGQIVATELPWSWGLAVRDGRIFKASYGWDAFGMRPLPRLLEMREGETHPGTLTRLPADALYAPVLDAAGTGFVVARAQEHNYVYRIHPGGLAEIVASRVGSDPIYGAALLPGGDLVVSEYGGRLLRVTRWGTVSTYGDFGRHIYQIAADADGNIFAATLAGDVLRLGRDGTIRTLQTGFGRGRLVAIAATADGDVYAAERGNRGRILRFRSDGSRAIIFEERGAQFYGVALESDFLYALDLRTRKLLRIPLDPAPPTVVRATLD
jgi:M6 family metalloprotease-like protein